MRHLLGEPKSTLRLAYPSSLGLYALAVGLALCFASASAISTPAIRCGLCAFILAAGLPHGGLDLGLLARVAPQRWPRAHLLAGYLAWFGAMWLVWRLSPPAALVVFFIVSAVHFAEDWAIGGQDLPGLGMGAATILAPVLLHRGELSAIFETLGLGAGAAPAADALLLIAPVAMMAALAAIWRLATLAQWRQAAGAILTLLAMVLLPPLLGFALYFGLWHSPHHLRSNMRDYGANADGAWQISVMTAAALGVAGVVCLLSGKALLSGGDIVATFETLSCLAVPHMVMPGLVRWLAERGQASPSQGVLAVT